MAEKETTFVGREKPCPAGYKVCEGYVIPNEWNVVRFEQLFHRLTRKNTENNQNVLTISAQQGLISQMDYYNTLYASENKEGYSLLFKGDFSYNKSYSSDYAYGAIKRLDAYDKGIVSPLYICFTPAKGTNSDYYLQYFEAGLFNREIYKIAQEGARNHGLLNVATEDFFKSTLVCPPEPEQERIAEILNQCDTVIELKKKRLEQERNKRTVLICKLLNRAQASVKSANGRYGTIGDLVLSIESGTSVKSAEEDVEYVPGKKFVLKSSSISGGLFLPEEVKEILEEEYLRATCQIESDTLLVSRMNTPKLVGACALCNLTLPNVFLPDRIWKVTLKDNVDPRWLNYILNSDDLQKAIQRKAGGTSNSMKNISQKDFLGIPIAIPSHSEQIISADIISAIDIVIMCLNEELKFWNNKKRALMQLLLSGVVRVNI